MEAGEIYDAVLNSNFCGCNVDVFERVFDAADGFCGRAGF